MAFLWDQRGQLVKKYILRHIILFFKGYFSFLYYWNVYKMCFLKK